MSSLPARISRTTAWSSSHACSSRTNPRPERSRRWCAKVATPWSGTCPASPELTGECTRADIPVRSGICSDCRWSSMSRCRRASASPYQPAAAGHCGANCCTCAVPRWWRRTPPGTSLGNPRSPGTPWRVAWHGMSPPTSTTRPGTRCWAACSGPRTCRWSRAPAAAWSWFGGGTARFLPSTTPAERRSFRSAAWTCSPGRWPTASCGSGPEGPPSSRRHHEPVVLTHFEIGGHIAQRRVADAGLPPSVTHAMMTAGSAPVRAWRFTGSNGEWGTMLRPGRLVRMLVVVAVPALVLLGACAAPGEPPGDSEHAIFVQHRLQDRTYLFDGYAVTVDSIRMDVDDTYQLVVAVCGERALCRSDVAEPTAEPAVSPTE